MIDIKTSNGWYREVKRFGRVIERLYCGNTDNCWIVLAGSSEQSDIEAEIAEALNSPDRETRTDFRVKSA